MKKITIIIGIILAVMLTLSVTSCEKKQGAAGTGAGARPAHSRQDKEQDRNPRWEWHRAQSM